jgi:hypothetical protein
MKQHRLLLIAGVAALSALSATPASAATSQSQTIKELRARVATLKSENATLRSKVTYQAKGLDDLRAIRAQLRFDNDSLAGKVAGVQGQFDGFRADATRDFASAVVRDMPITQLWDIMPIINARFRQDTGGFFSGSYMVSPNLRTFTFELRYPE